MKIFNQRYITFREIWYNIYIGGRIRKKVNSKMYLKTEKENNIHHVSMKIICIFFFIQDLFQKTYISNFSYASDKFLKKSLILSGNYKTLFIFEICFNMKYKI